MEGQVGIPAKPPRGHKTGKETGILMTVIKTLSSSGSTEHRDKERSKLEKEYKRSDQRLDGLISEHQESLNHVMHTFTKVCTEITIAKTKLKGVKENLLKCKMLLHCRREELERLWLEGIEHKHALEILEKIDKIRHIPEQFNKAIGRKQYLHASEILTSSLDSWDESLEQIEGLRDINVDLKAKKEKLYNILKEELYNELYTKWLTSAVEMKRQGIGAFNPFQRSSSDRRSSGRQKMNLLKAKKVFLDISAPSVVAQNDGRFANSKAFGDTEESDALIATVVQCFVVLREVPRLVEHVKSQMDEKLLALVNHTSQQIIEYGDSNGISDTDATLISDLLTTIFAQFRCIVHSHVRHISLLSKAVRENRIKVSMYSESDVWLKIQLVLQSTLKIYFDLSDSKSTHNNGITSASNFRNPSANDINSYFSKKRPARQKKLPLFKFEYSLHGLNINDYVNEQDTLDRSLMDKHRFLVCKPNPRNILVIYGSVHSFILEIESALNGQKCELRKFIGNNVNRVFVQQIYKDISDVVEIAKKNPDSWLDIISVEETKNLKCSRPLLQSVVQIGRSIQEVISLSQDLPSHSDALIRVLDALLTQYKDTCHEAYVGIVQPDAEDKGVISATWVRDEDIERLLKSLPNWAKLQKRKDKTPMETFDESPEDLRAQSIRESDLLCGIFGGKLILPHEILSDVKQLEQLAHLQESMEWFASTVRSVAAAFEKNSESEPDLAEPIRKVYSIAQQFQDIADTCLLVMHLEIRVHCFFFLLPVTLKGEFAPAVDSQVADAEVVQLNRDLMDIESALNSSLQPVKNKYIFEGVGQLVSTILINGAQDMRRINDNGVKKICRNIFSIQQTLCMLTNQPEHALDHARIYFELFTHPAEEMVDTILEKGPQFKELEYVNALKLLFRSKPGSRPEMLKENLERLSNILGDVGVTV
ncbi:unnamed protein product [Allacma fusca]|uniref:Exocyst complex component Sec8 n=1 Tax=Allacma fusca TaxID=39272 RepID=A0A8J2KZ28_9HEXA|nr:unnamed protein product [Allacma fusca]